MSEALRLADFDDYAQPNQRQNERILELTAQRDELLEALKELLDAENFYPWSGSSESELAAIEKARAVIAKAEQEK